MIKANSIKVISVLLIIVVAFFSIGCVEDYSTSLENADKKLVESFGHISAAMDLLNQERFDAAQAKLDEAVTALSLAESNVNDAKDKGATKEETDQYDAGIEYVKSWIPLIRDTIDTLKISKEMEEKGYSEELKNKFISQIDKTLNNLDEAENIGLDIIKKYPMIASELEVSDNIKEIKEIRTTLMDSKKMFEGI